MGDAGVDRAGNVVATWSELNPNGGFGQPDGMYGQRLDANLQKIGAPVMQLQMLKQLAEMAGMTQDEANANLRLLDIQHETVGDRLHLSAKIAPEMPSYAQPSVAWQVTGPVQLAVGLTSHNGGIEVQGTNGKLALETHNGGIHANATSADLAIATHNGDVDLDLAGGAVAGSIESHNGGIDVRLADGCSTAVEASTHNGRVKASRGEAKLNEDGNQATVRIGAGGGRLQVTTHNGDVTIR